MAGGNQHYIPRFLQRSFATRSRRRGDSTFGRGESAERRPFKRTASEDFFYSETGADGSATLDNAITRRESDLPAERGQGASPGDVIASSATAAIVPHPTQRTAHVRAAFSEGAARLLDRAEEAFPRATVLICPSSGQHASSPSCSASSPSYSSIRVQGTRIRLDLGGRPCVESLRLDGTLATSGPPSCSRRLHVAYT